MVAMIAKLMLASRLRAFGSFHVSTESYAAFGLSRAKRRLAAKLFRFGDGFVGVSEGISEEAIGYYELDAKTVTTIANPIPVEEIVARSETDSDPAAGLGPFVIGCGRLSKLKRFDDLVLAFGIVCRRPEFENYKLVILGTGPHRDTLSTLAEALGIQHRVLLLGYQENPHPYFRHSKAFVLSSETESLSNVLIEAMACGSPVIATRCHWGPEEVLQKGKYGLLYDVGDVQALAKCLVQVTCDREATQQRAAAARVRALDFSPSSILPKLEHFLFPQNGIAS
jgi:glycosyltransferase involved in cell wall biosynthesis